MVKFSLRELSFVFFLLFAFTQCLSISVGNYVFGIFLLFLVLSVATEWRNTSLEKITERCRVNKGWFFIFIFFLLTMLMSAISSPDVLTGLKTWFFLCFYRIFPFFIVLIFFHEQKKARLLLALSLLSCVIDVLVGFYLGPLPGGRYKGIYGHPMTLAGFLCVSLPVVFALLFKWDQKPECILIQVACFFVLLIGLLLNQTRGAWIAVAVVLFPLGLWLARRSLKKIVVLLVLSLGVLGIFQERSDLSDRLYSITSTTMQSNVERLFMWESALNMFKDDPAFGVGLGQYSIQYRKHYIRPEAKERNQKHAHSNIFQMLGENGLVGLIGFLSLFFYILTYGVVITATRDNVFGPLIVAVTAALLLQGLTEYNFGNSAVIRFYWLVVGSLVALATHDSMVE